MLTFVVQFGIERKFDRRGMRAAKSIMKEVSARITRQRSQIKADYGMEKMCIYIYMHLYIMHTCNCSYKHLSLHIYIYTYIHIYIYTHTHTHTYIYKLEKNNLENACVHTYKYIYVYIHMYCMVVPRATSMNNSRCS